MDMQVATNITNQSRWSKLIIVSSKNTNITITNVPVNFLPFQTISVNSVYVE